MFSFVSFASSKIAKLGRAIGNSVIGIMSGDADRGTDGEVYGTHGIVSRPSKATKGIRIRIGSLSIVIASYTYGVEPPSAEGACKIYGTDSDGVEKSSHLLDSDGKHVFNEGTKLAARKTDTTKLTLSTVDIQALATALLSTAMFTPSGSTPVPVAPLVLTGGEITSGTSEVLLP